MPPKDASAIGSAIAAVLAPLPAVDKAKVKLVNARTSKARAEWNKIRRQLRRNLKSKGVQCVKINDPSQPEQPEHITKAYHDAHCWDTGADHNAQWHTAVHSADNLVVLREADRQLC